MAILLVFVINGGSIDNVLSTPTGGEVLRDVPVIVEGLSEDLEVSGIPDTINVALIGPTFDIYTAKVSKNYEVYVDLANYGEGDYTIEYKYRNFSAGLDIIIVPENVSVKISPKQIQTFTLGHQFENDDVLKEEQSVAVSEMEHQEVEVRGSQESISQIHSVNAVIDLSTVDMADGVFSQRAKVYAYDRSGEKMDVEIIPNEVDVQCEISSYSKEVEIVPKIVGEVEQGYAIASMKLEVDKVKIYGNEEKLKDLEELEVTIDVSEFNSSKTLKDVVINQVDGINKMSVTQMDVSVDVEKAETKVITDIPIAVLNNTANFNIIYNTGEDKASVEVTAAPTVLDKISADDFKATIDLATLEEGQNRVFVVVSSTNYLLNYVLFSKERLIITLER
jgi:YbbR domain-containing protein